MQKQDSSPEKLGHFRVVDTLGRGGMGTVYVGVDETLDRRVALKVIRSDQRLDSSRKARFLREAKILAHLDHPGICKLHDFIEGEENDCLVLELVDGSNLRQVLNEATLDQRQKLDLARQLLDVLAAVHGQGIIHRDLTPMNVMVTPGGAVKVLDFGLARIGDAAPPSNTPPETRARTADGPADHGTILIGERTAAPADDLETEYGAVLGTAAYMSPEQARGEPSTAAGDMYSLGLILQELFTGRPPYARGLDPRELHRRAMWAETEPVTGVSAELTTLIERLTSLFPASRPSSVDAVEMLQAIIDRPRRRRRVRIVAAVWFVLAFFAVGMTIQYLRAERESRRAEEQAALAEAEATAAREVSEFLVGLFEVSDPGRNQETDVTARELLEAGADRIEHDLADQPITHARLVHTMGVVYHHLGDLERAQTMLSEALVEREAELGADHPDVAESLFQLGLVHRYLDEFESARDLMTRGLEIRESVDGAESVETAAFHMQLGIIEANLGRLDDAEARLRTAQEIYEANIDTHARDLASVLTVIAGLDKDRGRWDEAEAMLERAKELHTRTSGPQSLDVAGVLTELVEVLAQTGRGDEAEPLAVESLAITEARLGPDHPFTAQAVNGLAHYYYSQGRYEESAQQLRRALRIYETTYGTDHHTTATAMNNLGMVLVRQGELLDGGELLERALAIFKATLGSGTPDVAITSIQLARLRLQQERTEDAVRLFKQALNAKEQFLGPDNPRIIPTLEELAACLRETAREAEATSLEARAESIRASADDQ